MGNCSNVFRLAGAALFTFMLASCNADDGGPPAKAALPNVESPAGRAPNRSLAADAAGRSPTASPAMSRPASQLELDFEAFAASSLCHN